MPVTVPTQRIRRLGTGAIRPTGDYVLYWMTANRRVQWNFALDRAVELSLQLGKPLLIFEPLRAGYRWASDRLHRFVIDGMADNAAICAKRNIAYYPYVEPFPDADKGLLAALAGKACAVIGDDYPCFFLPQLSAAGVKHIPVAYEVVDANGIMPLQAVDKWYSAAVHFRRFLQAKLPIFLRQQPAADGLAELRGRPAAHLPADILARWPAATPDVLGGSAEALSRLLIDHRVAIVDIRGGSVAARARLAQFCADDLHAFGSERNQPAHDRASRLAPWLHFGHISAHEIVSTVLTKVDWSPDKLSTKVTASKAGWWGIDASSESFLDQIITWRELGFTFCHHRRDYDQWESLPDWARATLDKHASDRRPRRYTFDQLSGADTHDALWNAAQTQLLSEGRIHNYLRMLWGKKILEWSDSPRAALATLIELNNRFALDGRDPNSYSGIFWTLGRFDRPWAPERPIFGLIRYMSSDNTAKKMKVGEYVDRYTR